MSSTVRIEPAAKERLKRIKEFWRIARGTELSQEEILSKALEYLERHKDEFLSEAAWRPLTPAEIRALEKRVQGNYGDWSSEDIDEVVYGERLD